MATIIDKLIVTLGLESSDFDKGAAQVSGKLKETGAAADKTGGKFKQMGKEGGDSFASISTGAAKFLAIIGGTMAIKNFIEQTIESSAALDRLSKNLGTTADTVSAWSNAAELAGGSAEGLQQSMRMLSRAQTDLQTTGQSSVVPYFAALGVALADTTGKARPVNDILLDLAERFSKMDRTTAANLAASMGFDEGTVNLLLQGRAAVEDSIKRQKEFGAVTKKQAEEASKLRRTMIEGRQSFEAFGRELLSAATPALTALFKVFADMGAWMRDNKEFVQTFLTVLTAGLVGVAVATAPINATAVAVTGLAAAIALLYDDYQTWKRGGDSFIDWGKWEPGIKAATYALTWMRDLLGDIIYRVIAATDAFDAVLEGDWERAKYAAGQVWEGNGQEYGADAAPGKPGAVGKVAGAAIGTTGAGGIGASILRNVPSGTGTGGAPAATTAPASGSAPVNVVNSRSNRPAGTRAQEQAAIDYFVRQGWTREQAAGIVANIKRESALRPDAVGDSGLAYGLAQWHPDRQAVFRRVFGKPIQQATLDEQLAFIQYELTHTEREAGNRLRQSRTAAEAGSAVSRYYERPRDVSGEATRRGATAEILAATGRVPGASQAAIGAGAARPAAAAGLVSTQQNVQTNIGEIKVYTAATDANGIAKDMGKSMDYLMASQATTGLN